jgi:tellurite resistance protein TehA-like permease
MNFDSVDITDSVFSLKQEHLPEINNAENAYIYIGAIYIGAIVLILLIIVFTYMFYKNKQNKQNKQNKTIDDCPGGFCTMNNQHPL